LSKLLSIVIAVIIICSIDVFALILYLMSSCNCCCI